MVPRIFSVNYEVANTTMTNHKLSEEEQIALLRKCAKISAVKAPNQFGQKWVARVQSVTDGDTLNVVKYDETDGSLDRYIIRLTCCDCPEIKHKDGERIVTSYEQALGSRAKSTVLHEMLPSSFEICDVDKYDWRVQQKIFDVNPIIVYVNCPAKDHLGKPMTPDPYSRTLAAVAIMKEDGTKVDIATLLIDAGLADRYYGGTKERSFMKNAPVEEAVSKEPSEMTNQTSEPVVETVNVQRTSRKRKVPESKEIIQETTSERPIKKTRKTKMK